MVKPGMINSNIKIYLENLNSTFKERTERPVTDGPQAGKLTKGQFQEENWDSDQQQHNEVWNQECT